MANITFTCCSTTQITYSHTSNEHFKAAVLFMHVCCYKETATYKQHTLKKPVLSFDCNLL